MFGIRFFQPDKELTKSIVDYAGDRIIFDIGCGDGDFLKELQNEGAKKLIGIDPYIDINNLHELALKDIKVIPRRVEDFEDLIKKVGEKALFIFARPCHSNFVVNVLNIKSPKTEVLYITVPENLKLYNDLGNYKSIAKKINLKGSSLDNEIIMSIW